MNMELRSGAQQQYKGSEPVVFWGEGTAPVFMLLVPLSSSSSYSALERWLSQTRQYRVSVFVEIDGISLLHSFWNDKFILT
jgi:hypothetical protein